MDRSRKLILGGEHCASITNDNKPSADLMISRGRVRSALRAFTSAGDPSESPSTAIFLCYVACVGRLTSVRVNRIGL
jgi:hypothetical protein